MMIIESDYFQIREAYLENGQETILTLERKYMDFLTDVTLAAAEAIFADFSQATELMPFWVNYPPIQRGRAPSGTSIPWGEVGEKPIAANIVRAITQKDASITYPGLPLGSDIRFAAEDALIHFDIKLTGPNDRADEIVASPHQISGDGASWRGGVVNSAEIVAGRRRAMHFQPELPPFYVLSGKIRICLTYFLKAVYSVRALGDQPLDYLELVCVPNGLLLFDGPNYAQHTGLLIPGKDELNAPKKRTRVRLEPLAQLASWRCVQIRQSATGWQSVIRSVPTLRT